MTSYVRTDAHATHAGLERVQRAAENLSTFRARNNGSSVAHSPLLDLFLLLGSSTYRVVNAFNLARTNWLEARRRAKEEERHYNSALREARRIADLSRAMNGLAVENVRRYD
ncbi:hypothetical protein [Diaphorobacter caeni]|uniref:hypothetical protein n=1 Tax=Diaphorobacter caeni TaxID=2784387 RepID=UPI00188E1EAB|nr:hypothetical protein [Diaphorobacter caeni]MBF5005246.1 hypothetical protein [Diaphorobacter caeni]